ncbi:Aste57867_17518 [Aphanomyces stellatus]|uniref:Aste57867_17518 protein n=1 Tax=Aphanomyces stellatus TaxID=120398 RepID=A0A485L7Z7_9STRA|nr:hypothetical protein As57867_017458 [Aphanomyces stellatus]VFT94271.1 Aste57867_17518 [Aphanomyces stellatus]
MAGFIDTSTFELRRLEQPNMDVKSIVPKGVVSEDIKLEMLEAVKPEEDVSEILDEIIQLEMSDEVKFAMSTIEMPDLRPTLQVGRTRMSYESMRETDQTWNRFKEVRSCGMYRSYFLNHSDTTVAPQATYS